MGRPLYKDVTGDVVIGTGAGATTAIRVDFWDGSTMQTDGVIIKQRGSKTFVVCRVGDIGDTTQYYTCKLVDTAPNADGEMRILGYVGGNGTAEVPLSKITRRIAYGFPTVPVLSSGLWPAENSDTSTNHDEKKYTWYIENDSSADILVLTEITSIG